MSKYTTNFKTLIDGGFVTREDIEDIFKSYDLSDYLTQEEINIIYSRGTWDKNKLAKKIVNHYYLREIGFETYAMFRHYAKEEMEEIMESKLPLIYSSSIKYDPLVNVDYTEEFKRNIDSSNNSNSNTNTNSYISASGLNVNSDTPQGQIDKNSILGGSYASNTTANESESTGSDQSNNTTSNNSNVDEDYIKHVKGNSGVTASAQKMIEQYRQNIIAIDKDIINQLNDLFIGLF